MEDVGEEEDPKDVDLRDFVRAEVRENSERSRENLDALQRIETRVAEIEDETSLARKIATANAVLLGILAAQSLGVPTEQVITLLKALIFLV